MTTNLLLSQAQSQAQSILQRFAHQTNFLEQLQVAFGASFDINIALGIANQLQSGDFSLIPAIRVLSNGELGGANGAFAASLNEILVSSDFLTQYQDNVNIVAELLLEEIGHKIDRVLNGNIDSPGDEGAIFLRLATEQGLSAQTLARLKTQTDHAVITVDGHSVAIEQQDFTGTAVDDTITGTTGDDRLFGLAGNDELIGLTGADAYFGGAGNDSALLNYNYITTPPTNVTVSYTNIAGGTGFEGDTIQDVEAISVDSGSGNDNIDITATTGEAIVRAGAGDDLVKTGSGQDYISGGDGNDTLYGGAGDDDNSNIGGVTFGSGRFELFVRKGLYGEAGNDQIFGEAGNDYLEGGDGNDTLDGGTGNDELAGSAGDDSLDGGAGDDKLTGGTGADAYIGGVGNDTAVLNYTYTTPVTVSYTNITAGGTGFEGDTIKEVENIGLDGGSSDDNINITATTGLAAVRAGAGNDIVRTGSGQDSIGGGDGNDTLYGGAGDDDGGNRLYTLGDGTVNIFGRGGLYGEAGDDRLFGEAGNDYLSGGSGNDILDGGTGNDYLDGGDGTDYLDGGDGNDSAGLDYSTTTIPVTINYTDNSGNISGNDTLVRIENVGLDAGSGNDNINITATTGVAAVRAGAGDDLVRTGSGQDYLDGGDGDDTLYGGAGDDSLFASYVFGAGGSSLLTGGLYGGAGNDRLFGEAGNDILNGGSGNDLLDGGGDNDSLIGETGDDSLDGGAGNDFLVGGAGADIYIGGLGNDTAVLNYGYATTTVTVSYGNINGGNGFEGDTIREIESIGVDTGSGNDNIDISATTGIAAVRSGAGNDTIITGSGQDYLLGGDGDDILRGGAGDDSLFTSYPTGGGGTTLLIGGLYGGTANDQLFGEAGNDYLTGGAGNDILDGGAGDDIYFINVGSDIGTDTIVETTTGGDDTLNFRSSTIAVAVNLSQNTLQAIATSVNLIGNLDNIETVWGGSGVDTIIGNSLNNFIDGGGGADSMSGGAGNDSYVVDVIEDLVTENFNEGIDTVFATTSYALTPNVENLTLLNIAIEAVGNSLDNNISGNFSNNNLNGGGGNDTISGGFGNDFINGGTGNDSLIGGPGNDFINGAAGIDTAIFSGNSTDYIISYASLVSIVDIRLNSPDGSDNLAQVEFFVFADKVISNPNAVIRNPNGNNDFNGDNKSDILWRNDDGRIALLQMNGSTVTSGLTIGTLPTSWKIAGTGDFSGDNKSDILWRNDDGQIALWQMDGTNILSQNFLNPYASVDNAWKVAGTGDFGGDNKSDILWRNDNGQMAIWQMDGATRLPSSAVVATVDPAWKIAGTGDFGGDGKSDILWRNDNGSVALWQMDGLNVLSQNFLNPYPTVDNSWKIAGTGDFNGDSKSDILWRNDNGSTNIWLMDGANVLSFGPVPQYPTVSNTWKIAGTGDFNGDSKSDILWRNDNGSTNVWEMNGLNVLANNPTNPYPVTDNTWKIAAPNNFSPASSSTRNDFNGDKKSDILWRNDDGRVALWQMSGSTVTTGSTFATVSTDWKISNSGDFNGDRKADILWRNDNGQVALWTMDGATKTSGTVLATVGTDWKIAGAADFGGDRKADILWRNDDGQMAIWQMDGATKGASAIVANVSTDWKIAGTGDFGGDGKSDILWRNNDGRVALWQMDGLNVRSQNYLNPYPTVDNSWKISGTGDFNGDSKADILWRNDNGSTNIWLMDGANVLSVGPVPQYPTVDNSWKISGTGDFNGDGKSDILWRNTNGSNNVWEMNGSSVLSAGSIDPYPVISADWKIAAPIL